MTSETAVFAGAPRHALRRHCRRVLRVVGAALITWGAIMALAGDSILPGRLGIYLAPWLMLLAAGLAGIGLWLGTWRLSAGLAMLATGFAIALWPDPRPSVAPPGAPRITVITLSHRLTNPDVTATANFLRRIPADVVSLQEVPNTEALRSQLDDRFSCAHGNMLILSRWPLDRPRAETTRRQLFCDAETPAGPVIVASIHLPKARFDASHQQRGLARLMAALEDAERPVILAGDFNTTRLTGPYGEIRSRLENAHASAGSGLGMTFPTRARPLLGLLGPFLGIDHIFHSSDFVTEHAEVLSEHPPGADHFPVRAVLARVTE